VTITYGSLICSASVKGLTISGTVELAVSESDNSLYVKSLTGDASFDEVTVSISIVYTECSLQ
jgi:hypothetical protein